LKGSSGLKQIPDNVISIWRDMKNQDQDSIENEILVYVLKCRDDSGNTGEVILNFNKRSQSYKTRIN
jgi:replicative DNA helicase